MSLTQQQGDAACLAHVLSVDMLVAPPTCWILSGRFAAMHKTVDYLPDLLLIYSAAWQIAHYCHAYAALSLLQSWSLCFLLLMSIRMCGVGYEMHLHRKPCTAD